MKIGEGYRFYVSATSSFRIEGGRTYRFFEEPLWIKNSARGIEAAGYRWGNSVRIIPRKDSFSVLNGRRFRGTIIISKNKNTLEAINKVSLEEYLYGVLKLEISPDWPLSTLCSQAIVARTYAYRKLKTSTENKNYDLTNLSDDQVYGGVEAEDPRARIAVDLTRGQILTYRGEPIEAFYHACSGGYLASSKEVWGTEYPYLVARKDPFSEESPYYSWEIRISTEELEKKLTMQGINLNKVDSIKIQQRSESGRVVRILLKNSNNREIMSGREFRKIVGFDRLKSTLFEVEKRGNEFLFQGKGWGHGVGMSQWGAKNMGDSGHTVEQILEFYYPGTNIEKVY